MDANSDAVKKAEIFCEKFSSSHHFFFEGLIWSSSGKILDFNIADNGQSSSIFLLGTHKQSYPDIHFVGKSRKKTISLGDQIPN